MRGVRAKPLQLPYNHKIGAALSIVQCFAFDSLAKHAKIG
jgi:hypothetical protein